MPKRSDRRSAARAVPAAGRTARHHRKDLGLSLPPRELRLSNGVIERVVRLEPGISTTSFRLAGDEREFVRPGSGEIALMVDGHHLDGASGWRVVGAARTEGDDGAIVHTLRLAGDRAHTAGLELELVYVLYPGLPVVRKWLSVHNTGEHEVRLEAVEVERLAIGWSDTHAWTFSNHGRERNLGPYEGNWYDALILVHEIGGRRGIFLGNEAPGVTKRSAAFVEGRWLSAGLTHPHQPYPFRARLAPGERWQSPAVFTGLYHDAGDARAALNGPVNDLVRRHLGLRATRAPHLPALVYNTWNPFRTAVNDGLVRELAAAAADCGAEIFIIDDGWQAGRGDWEVDTRKFPGGLAPAFEHVRSLGMKPGLWISLAEVDRDSRVLREHPEWFVRDAHGEISSIHTPGPGTVTACLATGWYEHIRGVILGLVREHGLAYVKLDLSIAASSYLYDLEQTGCHALDHPGHRGRAESFLVIYRRCMELFDELHRAAPGLFIDCTFETWSMLQLIDYALAQHAEGDWLANVEQPAPLGSLRVRHLAWWRAPAMPAAALVIGNQTLDDPERELALLSVAGTLPLMLGDPRRVPEEGRAGLRAWVDWLRAMQRRHGYMLFRQDLPGFGEPMEGQWDGWARINTETRAGGILGVFRQGGAERERTVTVSGLDPERHYVVRRGPTGGEVARATGRELAGRGFAVALERPYDATLLEIAELS